MKKAFTLVEILITLSIIGVIATMTIPTFVENSNKRVYVAQLQRTYNILRNSIAKYMQDNETNSIANTGLGEAIIFNKPSASELAIVGCPEEISSSDPTGPLSEACFEWQKITGRNRVAPFLLSYFDVAISCVQSGPSDCVANNYTNMKGQEQDFLFGRSHGDACVILTSGATLCITAAAKIYSGNTLSARIKNLVYIDVNGKKGPNVLGRDAFSLQIAEQFSAAGIPNADPDRCTISGNGSGCFTKIIADGWRMEY